MAHIFKNLIVYLLLMVACGDYLCSHWYGIAYIIFYVAMIVFDNADYSDLHKRLDVLERKVKNGD